MMQERRPPIGSTVQLLHLRDNCQHEKTRVARYIGNYVVLENGIKFHVLDDEAGAGLWTLHDQAISITTGTIP